MKKKWLRTLMVLIVFGMWMTACASNDQLNEVNNNERSNNLQNESDNKEGGAVETYPPAEIVFYSTNGDTEDVFNTKYGNAVREKFPEHTISFIPFQEGTRYPDVIAADMQVDIIFESIAQFTSGPIAHGTAMDMGDLIQKHNIDLERLEPSSVDAMRTMTGGMLYGLPTYTNSLALYYNKDIFDTFGIDYPVDQMTWDEIFELNRQLSRTDGEIQYLGIASSIAHVFRMNPFSLPYINSDTTKISISDHHEPWRQFYEMMTLRLTEAAGYGDFVLEQGVPGINHFIREQNVAMLAGLTNIPITQDLSQIDWDVVSFPTYNNMGPQLYPSYFGVSSISDYPDQSMEIIQFLLSDEFQMQWSKTGNMPAVHSEAMIEVFAQDTDFNDKNVRNAFFVDYAPAPRKHIYDGNVEPIFVKYIAPIMTGEMDINTALRHIEEEGNQILAELSASEK